MSKYWETGEKPGAQEEGVRRASMCACTTMLRRRLASQSTRSKLAAARGSAHTCSTQRPYQQCSSVMPSPSHQHLGVYKNGGLRFKTRSS